MRAAWLLLLPLLAGCPADTPPAPARRCKLAGPVAVAWSQPQPAPVLGGSFQVTARLTSGAALSADYRLIAPAELVVTGGALKGHIALTPGQAQELHFTVQVTQALAPASLTLAVTAGGLRDEHYVDVTAAGATPRDAQPRTAVNGQGKTILVP